MLRYSLLRKIINKIRHENGNENRFYDNDSYNCFILLSYTENEKQWKGNFYLWKM